MPDSNARYAAAASEIQTRIQARNNISLQFVTYSAAIIGIATSKEDWRILGGTVGYVALGTVLLSRSHTLFIAHLVKFQQELIRSDSVNSGLPDWNSAAKVRKSSAARRAADQSQFYFLIASLVLASLISLPALNPLTWTLGFWGVNVITGITAIVLFYNTSLSRDEIMTDSSD